MENMICSGKWCEAFPRPRRMSTALESPFSRVAHGRVYGEKLRVLALHWLYNELQAYGYASISEFAIRRKTSRLISYNICGI